MAKPVIFVSYSHRDDKNLKQLRDFLRPLERDGLIAFWDDTRIATGDDWAAEIDQALAEATAAVLLISQHFLASEFITHRELPHLLARASAGALTILPVFLRHSTVDLTRYAYVDPGSGENRRVNLTRYQGFGAPEKPLMDLTWSQREKVFKELARRLAELAGRPEPTAGPLRRVLPRPPEAPETTPAVAFELTVELAREGDQLGVRYHLPGLAPIASAEVSWDKTRRDVEPIARTLDDGDETEVGRLVNGAAAGCGAVLFNLLFGPDDRWQPVLRAVFGKTGAPAPNPPWAPVRLRVATEEPLLCGLPWRLTAWNGRLLAREGWVFTTTRVIDPVEDYTTTAPADVLIVAPQNAVGAGADAEHPRAVTDLLTKVWPTGREPGYVRTVKTRRQLENAWRGMRPHVLYIYAAGEGTGRPRLLLDAEDGGVDRLALGELPELFSRAGHQPAVVFFNTTDLAAENLPARLASEVPLVVRRRLPRWTAASTTWAIAWLQRWLGEGWDPTAALHGTPGDVEGSTLVAHGSYRTWKTATYQLGNRDRFPKLRLDRDGQKAQVRKCLAELARSDARRVVALVAYAAAGNALESLWKQLQDHLDLELEKAAIRWLHLDFPIDRTELRQTLESELRLQLDADPKEPVPHLLRRHGPEAVTGGKRAILWLNWGVFGPGFDQREKLNPDQLGEWLRFSSQYLGIHCPADLRVVSYLALEVEESRHARLQQTLQEHRRQDWCRTREFLLKVVPPLGKVYEDDLLDFLEEPESSSCDPGIQAEVAQRIIVATGGKFEPTVALVEAGERGSWYDLLARLRREQGAEVSDDEPF